MQFGQASRTLHYHIDSAQSVFELGKRLFFGFLTLCRCIAMINVFLMLLFFPTHERKAGERAAPKKKRKPKQKPAEDLITIPQPGKGSRHSNQVQLQAFARIFSVMTTRNHARATQKGKDPT